MVSMTASDVQKFICKLFYTDISLGNWIPAYFRQADQTHASNEYLLFVVVLNKQAASNAPAHHSQIRHQQAQQAARASRCDDKPINNSLKYQPLSSAMAKETPHANQCIYSGWAVGGLPAAWICAVVLLN